VKVFQIKNVFFYQVFSSSFDTRVIALKVEDFCALAISDISRIASRTSLPLPNTYILLSPEGCADR